MQPKWVISGHFLVFCLDTKVIIHAPEVILFVIHSKPVQEISSIIMK